MGHCRFNPAWLRKRQYAKWLRAVPGDPEKALCSACQKGIDIAVLGESALRLLGAGKKHSSAMVIVDGSDSIRTLFHSPSIKRRLNGETVSVSSPPSQTVVIDAGPSSIMDRYAVKNDVWWAEVLWTLCKVSTHQSD